MPRRTPAPQTLNSPAQRAGLDVPAAAWTVTPLKRPLQRGSRSSRAVRMGHLRDGWRRIQRDTRASGWAEVNVVRHVRFVTAWNEHRHVRGAPSSQVPSRGHSSRCELDRSKLSCIYAFLVLFFSFRLLFVSSVMLFFSYHFFPDKIKWRLRHHPVVPYVMQRSPQHRYPTRGSQPVNSEVSPSRPPAPVIEAAADSSVARKAKRQPDPPYTDDVRFAFSYILDHEFSKEDGELLYTVS